ncbi:MAG: methylglyoxal synthase [Prevotellaceae bacterium]|jgi:methylglyoxal synthase|nr:methylglyoxal synthase [Prevotellaceae bacterium]
MKEKKTIALVAHDNKKKDIIEWVDFNHQTLIKHNLVCTGTTGRLIEECLQSRLIADEFNNINMLKLKSGPLGGDQQLGSLIVDGKIDILIFLWDPMQPQPHDVDVKALLRISSLYNIPTACNRSTADFIISSPIMNHSYNPVIRDYSEYINRKI